MAAFEIEEPKPRTKSTATAAAVALLAGETPKLYLDGNELVFEFSPTAEQSFVRFLHAKKQIDRMKESFGRTRA
jgi:hypothetical protein